MASPPSNGPSSDVSDGWDSPRSEAGLRTPVNESASDAGYASDVAEGPPAEQPAEPAAGAQHPEAVAAEDEGWVSPDFVAIAEQPLGGGRRRGRPRLRDVAVVVARDHDAAQLQLAVPSPPAVWDRSGARRMVLEASTLAALPSGQKDVADS